MSDELDKIIDEAVDDVRPDTDASWAKTDEERRRIYVFDNLSS